MQLVRIDGSSAVKEAGFEDGVVRVLWHSGNFSDYPNRTQVDFDDLLAAPSKGRFIRERFGAVAGGGSITGPTFLDPLDTYEHDECCAKRLAKALRTGSLAAVSSWVCPACGVDWVAGVAAGVGRHWRPHTWTAVIL